jgi:hypothetical protein
VGTRTVSDIQLESVLINKLSTICLIYEVPTYIALISFMWSNTSNVTYPLLCWVNESHFRKRLGRDFLLFVFVPPVSYFVRSLLSFRVCFHTTGNTEHIFHTLHQGFSIGVPWNPRFPRELVIEENKHLF